MAKTINTILNLQDRFSKTLDAAGKKTLIFKEKLRNCESAAKDVDKFLGNMAKTAVAASTAGIAAMSAFAASTVKTYGEFQKSMSNVAGILGEDVGSEAYKKLESAAREAGKSTTKTAAESADALSYMALAGWSVEESIAGLEPILRASEATGADLATTSDLVTDSMSALGLQTKELQHYLDVCTRAQSKSNMTLTQMQEAYIGVGGTFKTFGTGLQESGALLGILANRGIKGSEAGNSLQSTLVNLTKQSGESAKAMAAIGVSAYDSQGKFKGVTTVLKEVQAATSDMTEEQRNNYLTMIAGKSQLTTLNALMAGLSNTLEDGANEFQALYDTLGNCDGALDMMADTMTNNYAGAMARAGSAMDDLKIALGQKLEPYITKFLNWFSEKLPGATEKFSLWLNMKLPKAIDFCKNAFDKIKPVIGFVVNNFKNLAAAAAGVVVGLKAFSIITKVVSFMNKLKTAETALKAAQIALNTSMLACPLTWVAAAIGAVVGGFLLYKNAVDKAKEADIASHFGNITLSAEECGRMVQNVFGTNLINSVNELESAWDRVDSHFRSLSDSAMELNKLTFQVEMNPKNVSRDEYVEAAKKYVEDMQTAIKDKQYELVLDINFLFGEGSNTADLLNGQTSTYWSGVLQNAQNLGNELVANIAAGYENGWDEQSMEMVAKSLEKMSEIQEKIQMAQAQSQMELLTADFKMSDLSQESFNAYMEKLNEQAEAINEASRTAASNAMAAQKLMLDDGAITQEQYDTNIKSITEAYEKQSAEALNTALSEGMNAIREVYGDEFKKVAEQLNSDLTGIFIIDPDNMNNSMNQLQTVLNDSMSKVELSSGIKEKMRGFLETLAPMENELQKMTLKDQSLWKNYADTLISVEAMKTLADNGTLMGNAVLSGANSSGVLADAEKAGQLIKESIIKPFSETTTVTMPLDIKISPNSLGYESNNTIKVGDKEYEFASSYYTESNLNALGNSINEKNNSVFGKIASLIPGNATGTTYFGGGLTEINEHGGEIINLPGGAQIIPSDKSAQMVRETAKYRMPNISLFNITPVSFKDIPYFGGYQNTKGTDSSPAAVYSSTANNSGNEKRFRDINVNVNIDGNIIGLENAADKIGDAVCERIVAAVMAM